MKLNSLNNLVWLWPFLDLSRVQGQADGASATPTGISSSSPSLSTSEHPSSIPSEHPSLSQSEHPSFSPSNYPSLGPSAYPSSIPTWSDCVSMIEMETGCMSWTEVIGLTNLSDVNTGLNDTVTIPCEMCVSMAEFNEPEPTVIDLQGRGLDIEGILTIPNGTKLVIYTPFIFVQGKLHMESTKLIDGNVDIRIIMTGTEDVIFIPHERNKVDVDETVVGGVLGYNAGKKPILVAGGQIDIRGFPSNSTTWDRLRHVDRLHTTAPEEGTYVAPVYMNTADQCDPLVLMDSDTVTNPDKNNNVRIPKTFKDCVIQNQVYLYKTRVKLVTTSSTSQCATDGTNCPRLAMSRIIGGARSGPLFTVRQGEALSLGIVDNEWVELTGQIIFKVTHLDDMFNSMTISLADDDSDIDHIEVESLSIYLPPVEAYPTQGNVCTNLAVNGDAERDDNPFPVISTIPSSNKLLVKQYGIGDDNEDDNNNYFYQPGRSVWWSSLTFDLPLGCLLDKSVYYFSAKIKIHSDTPVRSSAVFKTFHPKNETDPTQYLYGGPFHFDILEICPPSSSDIGWVECDSIIVLDERHANATKVQFMMIPADSSTADISIDDIKIEFIRGQDIQMVQFDNETIVNSWAPGAEVLLTSQTFDWFDEQVLTISTIDSNGTVSFDEEMLPTTPATLEEQPDYAVEFALLSRNIVFESLDDDVDEPLHGGHLMIFRSPHCTDDLLCEGYSQHIEGVMFTKFGQEGMRDRFPINVYESEDLRESTFSFNAFRETYYRCININRSQRLEVTHNVAYNTTGACYVVERPPAHSSFFDQNIGARTIKTYNASIPGWDEEYQPATFIFTDPDNTITNNVAAGSEGVGYWFYNGWWSNAVLRVFDNNVAHSIAHNAIQTFPNGWDSGSNSVFSNIRVYRNRGIGWYCHLGHNFVVTNGLFSDNRISLDVNYCDGVTIEDTQIIGYTLAYEEATELNKLKRHCWTDEYPMYGVRIHPNNKNTRYRGSNLDNIDFSRFQRHLGCKGNKYILMNDDRVIENRRNIHHVYNLTVDSKYVFDNLKFDETIEFPLHENVMDFCPLNATTVKDMYIADDGNLNPEQNGYGFIVTDHPNMTMWSEKCVELKDTCSVYCTGEGSCMTKVTIGIDTQNTEDVDLFVYKRTKGPQVRGVDGIAIHDFAHYESRRFYWFYLPAGTYTGKFKVNGVHMWPTYAEIMIDHPHAPNCPGYEYNFELLEPEPPTDFCDELAINGDFEEGGIGTNRWFFNEYPGGFNVISPGYDGSAKAIQTFDRTRVEAGLINFVDTRCFVEGKRYEIEAKVKIASGGCNPNTLKSGNNRCTRASIRSRYDGWDLDFDLAVGDTLPTPFESDGWNTLFGQFVMTSFMVASDNVGFFFEGPDSNKDFAIDAVTITPVVDECEPLIFNAGFESGDSRYWKDIGEDTGLVLVDNSKYGGTGHSLAAVNRMHTYHGLAQRMTNKHCLVAGATYEVSVDYRLEETENGTVDPCDCDPLVRYSGLHQSCPIIGVKLFKENNVEEFYHVGLPIGPYKVDEWNKIYGYVTITEEMVGASHLEMYVSRAKPGKNLIIDNFVMKEADANTFGIQDCDSHSNLVINGDAETGDTRNWNIKGSGNSGLISIVEGVDGTGYAFHHSNRTEHYYGLWQNIDQSCLDIGSKWIISADFKLFDASGSPADCNPAKLYNVITCPMFFFQSYTYGNGLYQTKPLVNEKITTWNVGAWNRYEATFTMTAQHKEKDETWFFVHNVPDNYSYTVDNIRMVPAGASSS